MDISTFGFDAAPSDKESELRLFMVTSPNPRTNSITVPVDDTRDDAEVLIRAFLESAGYQEMGALKEDFLLQVSKGQIKTNYGASKKKECNFTLLSALTGGTTTSNGENINNTILTDGRIADILVMDLANCLCYEMRDLEIETGVKIQHKKLTELSFKGLSDSFVFHMVIHPMIGTPPI